MQDARLAVWFRVLGDGAVDVLAEEEERLVPVCRWSDGVQARQDKRQDQTRHDPPGFSTLPWRTVASPGAGAAPT